MILFQTISIEKKPLTLEQTRKVLEYCRISNKNYWKPKEITDIQNAVNYPNSCLSEKDINEILGLKDAVDYLYSVLLRKEKRISEDVILKLHCLALERVNPEESGRYRRIWLTAGGHEAPHPLKVESLMKKFITWLNSDDARRLHTIDYAALAHFKLMSILPFVDGNRKVSSLLMNLILVKDNYPLVVIKASKITEYCQAIRDGQLGDVRPFIRFIAQE
ncbi:hypothetical protein QYM36_018761 [Artemia franciscana]|uniref:Fido domain-containing protein n=1 Tax=Artemia franciscana TaxID=6661 RepID=A0AA88L029_ARTSF|nr:hypothetical protein QYM36_018761 [Artemia franciscana]